MVELPAELIRRLPLPEAHALRRVLSVIAEELPTVYADNVCDRRARDNANVFGLRVSVHIWSALRERHADLGDARIVETNNAHYVAIGDFKLAIHKLGHHAADDIHSSYPDGSPTQRAYAQRNANQLTLFEATPDAPLPDERAFALRDIVVGHFGNPEDGLAKWYVGAPTYDDAGRPRWAWLAVQPTADVQPTPDVVPYDRREPATVEVKPRRREDTKTLSDSGRGA